MKWGDWSLDTNTRQLVYNDDEGNNYEVNVDEFTSSAPVLDWIFQLQGKTWMTPQGMGDMLAAIDGIFHVQSSFCSGGQDHKIDATACVTAYIANPNRDEEFFARFRSDGIQG